MKIPSSKEVPNFNNLLLHLHNPSVLAKVLVVHTGFGAWNLEFLWNLELGTWSFFEFDAWNLPHPYC